MSSEDELKKQFAIFGLVSLSIITSFHIITSFKYGMKNGRLPKSVYWSFALCGIAIWHCLQFTSRYFQWTTNPFSCFILGTFGPAMYAMLHLNLYLLFILRIHEAYGHTPVACSTKKLAIWTIIIIIWGLCNMSMIIIPRLSHISTNFNKDKNKCSPYRLGDTMDTYFRPSVTTLNVICCLVNTFLFIRPIHLLSKKLDNTSNSDNTVNDLRLLSIKQCILSCIATLSTVIAMVGIAETDYSAIIWLSFDWILTLLSVILMYSWNNKYTNILCWCLYSAAKLNAEQKLAEIMHSTTRTRKTERSATTMVIHEYSGRVASTSVTTKTDVNSKPKNPLTLVQRISNQISNKLQKKNSKTKLAALSLKETTTNPLDDELIGDIPPFKLTVSQSEPVPTYLLKSHTPQISADNII
eukprot:345230_1